MSQITDNITGIKKTVVSRQLRRRGSYRFSIGRRAAVAAGMVLENGWTAQQAAGLLCVNPIYVGLARHLGANDRLRLARGELKLSDVYKDHRRRLAERRAQRLAAAREAEAQAARAEQVPGGRQCHRDRRARPGHQPHRDPLRAGAADGRARRSHRSAARRRRVNPITASLASRGRRRSA
jgi:hypothetical protein